LLKKLNQPLPPSILLAFFYGGVKNRLVFALLVGAVAATFTAVVTSFQEIDSQQALTITLVHGGSFVLSCTMVLEISFGRWTQNIPFVAHKTWGKFYCVSLLIFLLSNGLHLGFAIALAPTTIPLQSISGLSLHALAYWLEITIKTSPFFVGILVVIERYFHEEQSPDMRLNLDLGKGLGSVLMRPQDIISATSEEHYINIQLQGKEQPNYWVRMPMAELISQLPGNGFVQTHRSYLVNLAHTTSFTKEGSTWQLTTVDGTHFPVSRRRLTEVKLAWGRVHAG